jgi:hypothetical protein
MQNQGDGSVARYPERSHQITSRASSTQLGNALLTGFWIEVGAGADKHHAQMDKRNERRQDRRLLAAVDSCGARENPSGLRSARDRERELKDGAAG